MNEQLIIHADQYCCAYLNTELEDFSRPLEDAGPCGPDLRLNGLYSDIGEARREDDPSLPRGDWAKELKRADWPRVSQLASGALLAESKDLQLCAWLLEAEVKQRNYAALGPGLVLIHQLVGEYWEQLNPPVDELERRRNVFVWIDDKLPPVINQIAIAESIDGSESFSGVDLDRAYENEHRLKAKLVGEDQLEGPLPKDIQALVARTPSETYVDFYRDIQDGLDALDALESRLDELFGRAEAPGFSQLRSQLRKGLKFVEVELQKRGLLTDLQTAQTAPEAAEAAADPQPESSEMLSESTEPGPVDERQKSYEQLASIAHQLARLEPHSPVPYLIMRAVEWGSFNTAELYQDLFLVNKGQIDLFEIMGITAHQEPAGEPA